MDKKTELMNIAQYPSEYLNVMGKSLEARLEETNVSDQAKEIVKENTVKTIRNVGLSLLGGVGDAISTILDWNEEVHGNITEAKKMILLEQYFNKADDHEQAINMLKEFLISPQGNTLFNKVLRIVDDSPPDKELTGHLGAILKGIIEQGKFEELFTQHKYALSQIERLTPQALTIISDYRNWPPIKLGSSFTYGPKVTSDWYSEFTQAYCESKKMYDIQKIERVRHSVRELQTQGFMEAYNGENNLTNCKLTAIGESLLPYLQ
ncbi:hypothetical protein [Bacillus wiedmannii]|uniref:hypothetical protein n=1 Tax=Bacillus wiedmannii TaxID=1890302 RepID=UPI000BFD2A79|nr:hypothetical protein [Bacillus wiedmannii]PHD98786.1 hypothetical protein COF56_23790 [Bacillus wiedmannii]PHG66172.1 hypothetical protein COI55_19230 [Bacillus wiedmannii]